MSQLSLVKKVPALNLSEKVHHGLFEQLLPRSTVVREDEYTAKIKGPDKMKVTIKKSDMAKFGTETKKTPHSKYTLNAEPRHQQAE